MFVKICGVTNEEDALLAVALGADAVGFVFAPSTRQVTVAVARDVARRLPPDVLTVGVFRNDPARRVVEIVNEAGLAAAQLHGHESIADTQWVRQRVPMVIKGFAAGDPALEEFDRYGADVALIDSPSPGSGRVFDWSLAEGAPMHRKVLLAGGLTPANVADAIRRVHPWGVDVSSGVEAEPGRKDAVLLRRFIDAAKAAAPAGGAPRPRPSDGAAPFDWQVD